MKLSLCTISFRHHLLSLDQIAHWARLHDFQGIELWGIHAKNLAETPEYGKEWLRSYGLETSMISDYLPLEATEEEMINETKKLSDLAKHWGTTKIRTFVGKKGSAETTEKERGYLVTRLRTICDILYADGQVVLVETHPHTLADSLTSTLQLIKEVNHPALRINFDVLHVWESGVHPLDALELLRPYVSHFHLKNIQSSSHLHVFAPENVYAAAGSRDGMVSLFEGAVDYHEFFTKAMSSMEIHASLEWFGRDVKQILKEDATEMRRLADMLQKEKV
ncbi:sugar phosphate isomerase/epimerase family protein [Bacillus weihaiensis]|uniref:3-dehydroshikimate dehydratase n=1 Tax=Bacillus weihaiensis TaxID=1547283 RepID=A0A1L3MVV7_9BACI|nr:sugar phosphate isomerase/epimerase [Bacillus weihaiensis]APH06468.1 3-dehydroshikimate dehydratase [Bacillus weihaiensis]